VINIFFTSIFFTSEKAFSEVSGVILLFNSRVASLSFSDNETVLLSSVIKERAVSCCSGVKLSVCTSDRKVANLCIGSP
jgi:hypothetical protein